MRVTQLVLDNRNRRTKRIKRRGMHRRVVISGSANQFRIRRHRQDTLHTLKINRAHMLNRLNKLLLLNTAEQSLLALQNARSHKHSSFCCLSSLQLHISIWTYQIVRSASRECQALKMSGSPSLRGYTLSVGARVDDVGWKGPLWSPAVPRKDGEPFNLKCGHDGARDGRMNLFMCIIENSITLMRKEQLVTQPPP